MMCPPPGKALMTDLYGQFGEDAAVEVSMHKLLQKLLDGLLHPELPEPLPAGSEG